MKDGIYFDLPNEDYHANTTHISASRLKEAFKSLNHFWQPKEKETEKKDYFEFGNAFEEALTSPSTYKKNVAICDETKRPVPEKDFRTKANSDWKKKFYSDNLEKIVISKEDDKAIKKALENVKGQTKYHELLKRAEKVIIQASIFWTDEETGQKLKTRPDVIILLPNGEIYIIDIKTAREGEKYGFSKAITNLNYPIQASLQIDGVEKHFEKEVTGYFYLTVESVKPYNATIYSPYGFELELINGFAQRMRKIYRKKLLQIKKSRKDITAKKQGYADKKVNNGVVTIEVGDWYFNNLEK